MDRGRELCEIGRFLIPLGDPAVAYWRSHLCVARGLRQRLERRLVGRLPGRLAAPVLCRRRWSLAPGRISGDSERRHGEHVRRALELVTVALGEHRPELFADLPLGDAEALSWILLVDYPGRPRERSVVFLFRRGQRRPAAVLKLRRAASPGVPLAREWDALRNLARRLPPGLRETVPSPLAYRDLEGGVEALVLSALPGRPADVEMRGRPLPGRRVARHFAAAAAWLGRFQRATRSAGEVFRLPAPDDPVLAAAGPASGCGWYRQLERRPGGPIPLAAAHGDFWARNLLVDGGPADLPAVVDWEHYRPAAPPFEDLFHFAVSYGLDYNGWVRSGCRRIRWRRQPPEERFRRTFLGDSVVSCQVRLYLRIYCVETGLDAGTLEPLFRLFLLARAAAAGGPQDAAGETGGGEKEFWLRCYRLLEEAHRSVFSG